MAKEVTATTHELKSHSRFFEPVLNGTKKFELRRNDRGFKVGDFLRLREWNPVEESYTGREVSARVTHMTEDSHFVQPGIAALSIELVSRGEEHGDGAAGTNKAGSTA
jgi:hypothetical protein